MFGSGNPRNPRNRLQAPQESYRPNVISMRQARIALLNAGLYPQIDTLIESLPEPQRGIAKIEWEFATEVNRSWPLLVTLTTALGLTPEQVDQLFIEASQL